MKHAQTLVLIGTTVASAAAGTPPSGETQLPEVRVTTTRVDRPIQEVPHSVGLVTQEQLEQEGSPTIADALRDIPGVEVEDGSVPGQKRISIRGESSARVLILIDGQRVSEQKSMSGAVYLVDASMIDRIEVIKGPASVLYGSEAIAGVVNIITRKGGTKPLQLDLGTTYDSATDGWKSHASASGKAAGFQYSLSGFVSDQGDRRTAKGTAEKTGYQEKGGRVYLEKAWSRLTLAGSVDVHDSDLSVYTPEDILTPTMPHFQQELPEWSRQKAALFATWRPGPGPLAKLSWDVYRQTTFKDFVMDMDVKPSPFMTIQTRNRTQNDLRTLGTHVQSDWALPGGHYAIAGAEWTHDDLVAEETRRSRILPMAPTFTRTFYQDEAESEVLALFLQDEWKISPAFTLIGGLRQTWVSTELTRSTNPILRPESNRDDNLVGSLGVTWQAAPSTAFRFSAAQGYRSPNLQQLYMGTVHGSSSPTFGNPDLEPETSWSMELGCRVDAGPARLDAAVFQSENRDYITTVLAPTITYPSAKQFDNIDRATSKGLEASVSLALPGGFMPYASFTWMRRRFESNTLSTWKTGTPSLQGKGGLRYEPAARQGIAFHADLYLRFANRAKEESSEGSVEETAGWTTLNLDGGVKLGSRQQHRIDLHLENLLDRPYRTASESVPMAGRSVSVSLRTTF